MKKVMRVAILLLALGLASCSGGLADLRLPGGKPAEETPRDFYGHLANEYKNLAAYEDEYMKHPDDAEHFMAKARRALRKQEVGPDELADRDLPEFALDELTEARAKIADALTTLRTDENGPLLAMAQTRFDCWLAHQEDIPEEGAYIACRDEFYESLALLQIPADEFVSHTVFFDSASTELHEDAKDTIKQVAERYKDRENWTVVLRGYTDAKGGKQENKTLSMRRAIAVKNMLAQYGIPLGNIEIGAEGIAEAAEGSKDDRDSRRVDIVVRPAYLTTKKGLSTVPGWQHSGEF